MLRFLHTADLPPWYQVKANVVLSACDGMNEPWEHDQACEYYLRQAEEALAAAKQIYVHDPEDAEQPTWLEEAIQKEWAALHRRLAQAESK